MAESAGSGCRPKLAAVWMVLVCLAMAFPVKTQEAEPSAQPKLPAAPVQTGLITEYGYLSHEHTMFILWGLLADWLILLARYKKLARRNWYNIHGFGLCGLLLVFLMFRENKENKGTYRNKPDFTLNWLVDLHKTVAGPTFNLAVGLIGMGFFLRWLVIGQKEFDKHPLINLTNVRRLHMLGGLTMWFTARFCLFTGAFFFVTVYDSYLIYYVVLETLGFAAVFVFLENQYRADATTGRVKILTGLSDGEEPQIQTSDSHGIVKDLISNNLTSWALAARYPNQKVFLLMNKIFCLPEDFVHPGGEWLHNEVLFRDVTRYLIGNTGLESKNNYLWKHSIQAVEDLYQRNIGDLSSPVDEYRWRWCLRDEMSNVAFSKDLWRLSELTQLHSPNVKTIYFTNPKFRIRTFLRGIRWMGKHVLVTGQNGTTRMYSISITFAKQAQAYLNQMKNFYNLVSERPKELVSPGLRRAKNALASPRGIPATKSMPTNPAEPIVSDEGQELGKELDLPHLWPIRPKEIEELPITFKCYAAPANIKVPVPNLPQNPEAAAPINMNKRRRGKKALELKPTLIEIAENSVADSYVNMSQFEVEMPDKYQQEEAEAKESKFVGRDQNKPKTCLEKSKAKLLPLILPTTKSQFDPETSLSTELFFSSGPGKKLLIEGPVGRGYEFDVDYKGKIVIITAGTGYLPFADLVAALFLRAVFQGLEQLGAKAQIVEDIKRFHERYSSLLQRAEVKLMAAFDSEKELFEKSFINETYAVCKKHHFGFFDCLLRFSKDSHKKNYSLVVPTTKKRFDEKQLLEEHTAGATMVILCGPQEMTSSVYKTLTQDLNFPKTSIIFH